jgi:hypothetical protein
VEFKPGRLNAAADALSRRDEEPLTVHALSIPEFNLYDQFCQDAASLLEVVAKRGDIEAGTTGDEWTIVDDMVLHKGRIFMMSSFTAWPLVLEQAHGMGHEGMQKTINRLRASFYTPQATKLVQDFIRGCSVYQHKTQHLHPGGLPQPLIVPSSVWADIAMDFGEGFSKADGKSVILTMVDRFSKYAHSIPLGHPYSATTVAKAFFDQVVWLHGIPLSIVSDRDPVFTSSVWRELFHLSGTQLRMSFAFRPQTDGQSEVTNRVITMYLHCLAGDRPKTWLQWLPWVEYCYNTSYQTALRTTPFHVVYGRAPPPMIPYQLGAAKVAAADQQLHNQDVFLQEVRDRLLQAQSVMKVAHNKQHRDLEFMVGNWVWLCLNQRAASSVHDAPPSKLASKYFGPYEVIQRIG